MFTLLAAAAAIAAPQASRQDTPRNLVHVAEAALAGDTVARVEARWEDRVRRDRRDDAAAFGLGVMARLTYRHARVEERLGRLSDAAPPTNPFTVHARVQLGHSFLDRGLLAEASAWYEQAAALAQAGGDGAAWVESTLGLVTARARTTRPTDALMALDSAARLIPPGDRWLAAAFRCRRAGVLVMIGRADAAAEAEAGLELARRAGDPRLEASCLHAIARDLVRVGNVDSAGTLLEAVAETQRRVRDRAALAATLQWRGYLATTLGSYGDARRELQEAIAEAEASGNLSALAWASINLAGLSLNLSDFSTAEAQLTRAEELLVRTGDRWGAAMARQNQAYLLAQTGDTGRARSMYHDVLAWARETGQFQTELAARRGLFVLALEQSDPAAAERQLDEILSISERFGMIGWRDSNRLDAAALALLQGQPAWAEAEVMDVLRSLHPTQYGFRYKTRALGAEIQLARGRVDSALSTLEAAATALDEWRASLSDAAQRVLAFQWRDQLGGAERSYSAVIAGAAGRHVDRTFALAEGRRARELRDRLLSDQAVQIDATGFGLSRPLTPVATPTASDVMAALPDEQTALMEYVTGSAGQPTTVFVITRWSRRAHRLTPIDSLVGEVNRFVALVEDGEPPPQLASRLGDVLLAPAVKALPPGVRRLVIVPDGVLHRLPFDALRLSGGEYAIARFAISVSPSAAVAAALWKRPARGGEVRLLALADPAFEQDVPGATTPATEIYRAAFADVGGLIRLRGSAREARRVSRYASTSQVRVGADASEAFLKRAPLDSFHVIHLATHAVVDQWSVARTALALAPGDGEDGFLGPADLASLSLNADLIVLSACRTAGGVLIGGEGVRGLAAPLLQAGARAVVATGWDVRDRTARRLSEAFYAALAEGATAGDALQAAKLRSLERGAPARDWAVFTLVGDPMVRVPLRKPRWWQFWR